MKRFLKALLTLCFIFTLSACADAENDENGEEEISEEMVDDLSITWQEQRDEFAGLAEFQIEDFKQQISEIKEANGDEEAIANIESRLEETEDKLSDLEETEEDRWEELRDDIAGIFVEIQASIDEL